MHMLLKNRQSAACYPMIICDRYIHLRNGRLLNKWILNNNNCNTEILKTKTHTCERNLSKSYIDLVIINDKMKVKFDNDLKLINTRKYESDHLAIEMYVVTDKKPLNIEEKIVCNFAKANMPKLIKFLEKNIENVELPTEDNASNKQIDSAVENLNNVLEEAIKKYISVEKGSKIDEVQLSQQTLKLIKEKKNAKKKIRKSKNLDKISSSA